MAISTKPLPMNASEAYVLVKAEGEEEGTQAEFTSRYVGAFKCAEHAYHHFLEKMQPELYAALKKAKMLDYFDWDNRFDSDVAGKFYSIDIKINKKEVQIWLKIEE